MPEFDAASVLFPNDTPSKPIEVPDGPVQVHRAEQRLATDPARDNAGDTASQLFSTEGKPFEGGAVTDFFDGFALSAAGDGDTDRASALQSASEALVSDFKSAGTDSADLAEAFAIVKERQADTMAGPVSAEKLQEDFASAMASLETDGVTIADIDLARRFVADLERKAPGTMASLEATGAGNDPRLIRKAISEAKRRGYR
ncbi:hypothetical protein [Microvirga sp. TS319]|uniref:hypothetical protein n=1 Tax=Microvirga sp. TS319 TaxID=3241165 RepID=UPI003519E785